jgi:ubiquinone/menaquinone biosynthesis C-methylase UbiE
MKILDIACGAETVLSFYNEHGDCDITGVDVNATYGLKPGSKVRMSLRSI